MNRPSSPTEAHTLRRSAASPTNGISGELQRCNRPVTRDAQVRGDSLMRYSPMGHRVRFKPQRGPDETSPTRLGVSNLAFGGVSAGSLSGFGVRTAPASVCIQHHDSPSR